MTQKGTEQAVERAALDQGLCEILPNTPGDQEGAR